MAERDEATTGDRTVAVTKTELDEAPGPHIPALASGELVAGRYRIVRLLGRGGYGEVYEVCDTRHADRRVALKLHRLRRISRGALDALKSEFALLSTLTHPNLAQVHDFAYIENEYAFFTQTLIEGVPLARLRLDPTSELGADLLAQLCRALDYLHSRGIVHGDVKPGNILIDEDEDRLVLLDFGVSRALGASMGARVVGSPPYMAPELITGGAADGRTDLYALGVTLYQMVSGHVPFRGTSTQVMMAQVENEPPDLPPSVPLPVQALIARLIAKDPEQRPHQASEVIEALSRIAKVELTIDTQQTLASHVLSAPLVGREEELKVLLERALAHRPQDPPVMLVGPGGSGKSRLVREVRQRAQLRGKAWLQVQAPRSNESLMVALARALLGPRQISALEDEERIELARALPELRRPRERIAVPMDPDQARRRRIGILVSVLRQRFAAQPGVLAIEDLHWASERDRDILGTLIGRAREAGAPCFFLIATRPGLPESVQEHLGAELLPCVDLSPAASRSLVESIFGDASVIDDTDLGARIRREPSPALWLQESLRLAIEEGAVVRTEGRFEVPGALDALPIGDVLASRVKQLPRDAKTVALASAVLAQAAASSELCKVAGLKPHRASGALAELVHRGIVERLTAGHRRARYAMHDRYADVVLAALPERRVRAARRRAGRMLARRDKKDFRGLSRAADELAAAGDTERALKTYVRASDLAEQAGRPEQAASLVEREVALRSRDAEELGARAAHLFDLALACGRVDLCRSALEIIERVATERGDPGLEGKRGLRRARLALREGDAERAAAIGAEALEAANEAGEEELACELMVLSSRVEYARADIGRSMELAEEAAERARQLGRDDLEAEASLHAALVHVRFGNGEESTAAAERAVRAAKRVGDPRLHADALRMLGNAHFVSSRRKPALRAYRRAVKVARACGGGEAEAKALNNVAICAHSTGQVREALSAWRRAIVLKERVGATASALLTYGSMSGVLNLLGEIEEARAAQEVVFDADRADARPALALAWGNRGDTEMLAGEVDRALEAYARGARIYAEVGIMTLRTHALAGRIRALMIRAQGDDLEEAERLLEELTETQEDIDSREERRRHLTTSALVLDARGEHEEALRVAREAARIRTPDTVYEDVFGSAVEARWVVAILLDRLGREKARDEAMRKARELLKRRVRALDREEDHARLLEHPLHRAIEEGRIEQQPGCTWVEAR